MKDISGEDMEVIHYTYTHTHIQIVTTYKGKLKKIVKILIIFKIYSAGEPIYY